MEDSTMGLQLFGHVHSGPRSKTGKDITRLSMLFPTQYDAGIEQGKGNIEGVTLPCWSNNESGKIIG